MYTVLTTARVGGRELPQYRREDRLDDILARVPCEKGAITTSRPWKLPERERGRGMWALVCSAGPGAERVLSEAGVEVDIGDFIGDFGQQFMFFMLPEEYMGAIRYMRLMHRLKEAV